MAFEGGYRKVSRKARSGRRRSPVPHKQHRKPGGISDPISRAMKVQGLRDRERKLRPRWGDDDEDMAA